MRVRRTDVGASAVEYSLIVVAIAAVIVLIAFALGEFTAQTYVGTCDKLAEGDFGASHTCA